MSLLWNSAFRRVVAAVPGVASRYAPTGPIVPVVASSSSLFDLHNHQQVRGITKTKKRILKKRAEKKRLMEQGIFPPKPPNYMDRNTPVINARTREERNAAARQADAQASAELKARMEQPKETLMRYHMEGLTMSDRVRKLFDLTNASQAEVVKAQKQRGMELFALRDGDTGSSAVQVIAVTTRIQQLQMHMRLHKKDKHSKRGLDALFVRRRKLLDYMERKEFDAYRRVVKTLGLVR